MLKRWSIENFKSFNGRTDIFLAPITIFAGANSSGKSTIIQSILLLKQTVQYGPINRPMALNGPLLKLGTFDDVKNATSLDTRIGIGWEIEVEDLSQQTNRSFPEFVAWPLSIYYGRMDVNSVSADTWWDVAPPQDSGSVRSGGNELLKLQPRLARLKLKTVAKEEGVSVSELTLSRASDNSVGPNRALAFAVEFIDDRSRSEIFDTKPEPEIVGATVRHFLPAQIAVRYDAARHRARAMASIICGDQHSSYPIREFRNSTVSPQLANEINRRLIGDSSIAQGTIDLFPETEAQEVSLKSLSERLMRYRRTRTATSENTTSSLGELRKEIEEILFREEKPQTTVEASIPDEINEGALYASQYFVSAVRYLGPLRDEPKPIYPLEALANPTEVGYKGEHTAAVLDLHRDRRIRYLPSSFLDGEKPNLNLKYATLHDAVVDWLSYVGVASEVNTADQGKVGHQLQVQTEGSAQFHDLTNVGVGVSQVLPIIVMALLAEPPTLLIFEQPELHLHPKVQARLADFFLSVALIGKQCLLETHSEYLIERFRRRVAEAMEDSLLSVLKIYFTERLKGTTICEEVEVSRYGAIASWPEDFFDQSQIETELILRAASKKRLAERKQS